MKRTIYEHEYHIFYIGSTFKYGVIFDKHRINEYRTSEIVINIVQAFHCIHCKNAQ